MKIALAQMKMKPTVKENAAQSIKYIKQAAQNKADLICFPELQLSPFFPQYPDSCADKYLMKIEDQIISEMQRACAENKIAAVLNLYLWENGRSYNVSPMIDTDGSILGLSKMVHIVQYKNFYEQDYYTPADTGFQVYDTTLGKIGIVICFDRHFPESIRSCSWQGADLIVVPAAITTEDNLVLFDWEIRVASLHNSVFMAMCNRTGREDAMDFSGGSIVTDPSGSLVVKADQAEQLLYATIDLSESPQARQQKQYIQLLRPDMYLPHRKD